MKNFDREPEGERQEKIEHLKIDLDKTKWAEKRIDDRESGGAESEKMGAIEIEVEEFNAELERSKKEVNFFLDEATFEARRAELEDKGKVFVGKIHSYTSL
jgi:hypothetical protein